MTTAARMTELLRARYQPEAVLVCGSWAEGTQEAESDFDAVVVTRHPAPIHDGRLAEGVALDVSFLSPEVLGDPDWEAEEWPQLYHAVPAWDPEGIGAALIARVRAAIDALPGKTPAEKARAAAWCRKMLGRARRDDPEGNWRRHWLLTESLTVWAELTDHPWFGGKKALARMAAEDFSSFSLYEAALRDGGGEALAAWVRRLEELAPTGPGQGSEVSSKTP